MNKKIIGSIIVVLLIIIAAVGYYSYTFKDKETFGSSAISVPDNYKVKENKDHKVVLKNKETKISVQEKNNTIDNLVNDYKIKHANETVVESSLNISGDNLKSLTLKKDNGKIVRELCFYSKNGKVYQMVITGKTDLKAMETIYNSTSINYFNIL